MIFLISNPKTQIAKVFNNDEKILYLDSLCLLKKIKDKNNLLILDNVIINDEGIVEDFNYFFEEIIITVNINIIITNQLNIKLLEIAKFHNVPLIVL